MLRILPVENSFDDVVSARHALGRRESINENQFLSGSKMAEDVGLLGGFHVASG